MPLLSHKELKGDRYFDYLRKLMRGNFCGTVTVNLFEGGIRSITKDSELVIPVTVKETVKLK